MRLPFHKDKDLCVNMKRSLPWGIFPDQGNLRGDQLLQGASTEVGLCHCLLTSSNTGFD